ncbi:MAG: AAA family ATPase [Planctomycetota bacterium]
MKITDIHVGGFGVWRDLELKNLSPRATVFYGANEAGKSTLMQFVRSVLYGYSPDTRQRYFPPLHGGLQGGSLGLVDSGERLTVARISDRGLDDPGLVSWVTEEGEYSGDRRLRELLGDVDEPAYNNVFAVGLTEIQELGTLSGTQAAEWLYRLTSGLDRVSLYDVIQGLRERRGRMLGDERSELVSLAARRDSLRNEIDGLVEKNREWSKLAVRQRELAAEIESAEDRVAECEHEARTYELAVGIKDNWRRRAKVGGELKKLAHLIPIPEDGINRLDELTEKIAEHRRQADVLSGQRQQLRDESRRLGINRLLVRASCRVEALAEQRDWLDSLGRRVEELEESTEDAQQRLTAERLRLANTLGVEDADRLADISAGELEDMQPSIKAVRGAQKELESAKRRFQSLTDNERTLKSRIDSAMVSGEKHGLPMDAERAGDLVAKLRRRLQTEQKLEQAQHAEQQTQQEAEVLLEEQVVPPWLFGWLLAAFIACGLLLGVWLFVPGEPLGGQGGTVALLACCAMFAAWVLKFRTENTAAVNLDEAQRQLGILERQITEGEKEKKKLDAELPMEDGSVELRLQAAEKHLSGLESMMPVEAERRRAGNEVAAAQSAVAEAERRLEEALTVWRSQLAALGIPDSIDPQRFLDAAERYGALEQLAAKLENKAEEAELRRRELATLTRRIFDLAEEVGCRLGAAATAEDEAETESIEQEYESSEYESEEYESESYEAEEAETDEEAEEVSAAEQLDYLLSEQRKQLADVERRGELHDRAKKLREQQKKHERAALQLAGRREALLGSCDCDDETAFRKLAADHAEADGLREKRKTISREIEAAVGGHADAEVFAELLNPSAVARLETGWETAAGALEEAQQALKALAEELGAVRQSAESMAGDDTLARRRLELGCVEEQLRRAGQSWRQNAVVSRVLERIRADYEQHRQPETLQRVTEYLHRLTDGRYRRVWTPLANDVLLVENAEGESLPVEVLSRGTREQLFLSVRLALVTDYAKRGINLPMVLDDVLVNFDVGRARTAAAVLNDFAAEGHQLLVFTCHEHIWEMFRDQQADCRRLPNRFGPEPAEEEEYDIVDEVVEEPVEQPVVEITVVEEVAEIVEEERPAEEMWYDYPFVERLEEEVSVAEAPAIEEPLPVASPAEAALAYILPEEDEAFRSRLA